MRKQQAIGIRLLDWDKAISCLSKAKYMADIFSLTMLCNGHLSAECQDRKQALLMISRLNMVGCLIIPFLLY